MTQWERWWFRPENKESRSRHLSSPFLLMTIISFFILSWYQTFIQLFLGDKKEIITNDFWMLANYISIYNKETALLVNDLNTIIQWYINNQNIFYEQNETLNRIRETIISEWDKLLLEENEKYKQLFLFIKALYPYKDEIFTYMWANVSKSYLIILQNTSEKRPNGWFFWSFAYVRILHGKIRSLHIIDSYLWYKTMPWVTLTPPERSFPIYKNQPFWWIAANKFWFTNIDGDNLIQLYNKTFNSKQSNTYIPPELCNDMCNRPIDGVIFVKTDILKKLIPWLDKKTWERQFMNAAIDLIRGDNLPNKKEYYLRDSKEFFSSQQNNLLRNFVSMFWYITSQYSFWVYIPNISEDLNNILTKYNFTTIPNNTTLYSRDTNKSFNKIDEFVDKTIIIRDHIGDIIKEHNNLDQIDITTLQKWSYTLELTYDINVPDQYKDFISLLERKNNVILTDRERGILSLQPSTLFDNDNIPRLRATRSQLYYPKNINIISTSWDLFNPVLFDTPFWKGFEYSLETAKNHIKKTITINFYMN
jgi:hypothetical protein